MTSWRTRRDKRRYQKRDRVAARRDSDRENDARRRIIKPIPRINLEASRTEFTDLALQLVKDFNRGICESAGKKYCVRDDKLRGILTKDIRYRTDSLDPRQMVYRRAANAISGIAKKKPFCSRNAPTALAVGLAFLRANGLFLP